MQGFDAWGEEEAGQILCMSFELSARKETRGPMALENPPHVGISLETCEHDYGMRFAHTDTLLLPAANKDPLLAALRLDMETSSAGVTRCVHLLSPRSHSRMLPPRSALTSSP